MCHLRPQEIVAVPSGEGEHGVGASNTFRSEDLRIGRVSADDDDVGQGLGDATATGGIRLDERGRHTTLDEHRRGHLSEPGAAAYDANPGPNSRHFPEQHFQLVYSTQCCSFFVERLTRDFGTADTRRELYFRVDLRGVGKLLQKTF